MVAVINTGHSLRSIFNYNENKVAIEAAECIGEGNYPMDLDQLSASFKLNFLLNQLELNENVTRNSVHISLNFDPSETNLSKEKLNEITSVYMAKIGFGAQPYLVYQHHDSGHPHIHIVSIKVKADGTRIDMHNIGRNQSESARQEIEKAFGLVQASGRGKHMESACKAVDIRKLTYGHIATKKAVSDVLRNIIPNYKFTTLGELNAVLNLYNVTAESGKENSRVFQHKGLLYRILDEQKKPVGIPIKASRFYNKPTLKNLEIKFETNKKLRVLHNKRIKNAIDLAFLKQNKISLRDLEITLQNSGITAVFRKNEQGLLYGITYVDHTSKCVFNGSALGSTYAAKGILERCGIAKDSSYNFTSSLSKKVKNNAVTKDNSGFISAIELQKIIDSVLQPEFASDHIPHQLKNKKKRRKKGQSNNQ